MKPRGADDAARIENGLKAGRSAWLARAATRPAAKRAGSPAPKIAFGVLNGLG